MNITLKLAALSAVLSIGLVSAFEAAPARSAPAAGKMFQDRVMPDMAPSMAAIATPVRLADASGSPLGPVVDRSLKGDLARPCAGQAWPHLSAECLASTGAPARKVSRTISLESRDGTNVSSLTQAPAARR